MLNYKPVGQYLLIRPETQSEVSKGGIIIPEQARNTLNEGEIVSVGPHVNGFNVGETIVFSEHSESKIRVDGEILLLVEQPNILLKKIAPAQVVPAPFTKEQLLGSDFRGIAENLG